MSAIPPIQDSTVLAAKSEIQQNKGILNGKQVSNHPEVSFSKLNWWQKILVIAGSFFTTLFTAGFKTQKIYNSLLNLFSKSITNLDSLEPKQEEILNIAKTTGITPNPAVKADNKRELLKKEASYISQMSGNVIENWNQQDLTNETFFKKFMEQDPTDPFRQQLKSLATECSAFSTSDSVEQPNRTALELQALNYNEKYSENGVCIKIAGVNQLNRLVDELKSENPNETYIGIVVGRDETVSGHVLPLLCYLGPKDLDGNREIQFLVMDVLGINNLVFQVQATFIQEGIKKEKIIKYFGQPRQADEFSCRTGALNVLCNALLSLDYNHQRDGFAHLPVLANEFLDKLPAQWVVHEQIFHTSVYSKEELELPHIRDLVSKKPKKRTQPRTIEQIRKAHRRKGIMRYILTPKDGIEKLREIPLPPNVKLDFERGHVIITQEGEKEFNTYLAKRAKERKKELDL